METGEASGPTPASPLPGSTSRRERIVLSGPDAAAASADLQTRLRTAPHVADVTAPQHGNGAFLVVATLRGDPSRPPTMSAASRRR